MIEKLKRMKLDMVTLGTPFRYEFNINENIQLLHLINHRGEEPLGGLLSEIFFSGGGDYIQQWGLEGSDGPILIREELKLNRELDRFLDKGISPQKWLQGIKKRRRVPPQGQTFLIDYGDRDFFIFSICGHGIYTKVDTILMTFSLINHYFYK